MHGAWGDWKSLPEEPSHAQQKEGVMSAKKESGEDDKTLRVAQKRSICLRNCVTRQRLESYLLLPGNKFYLTQNNLLLSKLHSCNIDMLRVRAT